LRRGDGARRTRCGPRSYDSEPIPSRKWLGIGRSRPTGTGAAAARQNGQRGRGYLIPVVAKPLTRKRWPKRNTRNSGIRETTDIANIAPQSEEPWVSRNDFSASGTVKLSGVVR